MAVGLDGVVPLGQRIVGFKSEPVELLRGGFDACGIMTAIQVGRDG